MQIGDWIRRQGGKWHVVESIVSDDAITRCGRRMAPGEGWKRLEVRETLPLTRMPDQPQLCRLCYR